MVVVVQFLAADQYAPWGHVGRGIGRLEVAVTPPVAQAVDDAGGPPGNPDHLHGPHHQARGAEQRQVQDQHHTHALPAVAGVEVAFDPVVRRAVPVLDHGLGVAALGTVQLHAREQQGLDATRLRAVRVFFSFALRMMLAVDGHKLLGHHARGQPQPTPKEMRHQRVQVQGAVRLGPVQEDGNGADRHVGRDQRVNHDLPPGRRQQAETQPLNQRVVDQPQFVHQESLNQEVADPL